MRTKTDVLRHFDDFAIDGRWADLYDHDGDAVLNHSFIARRQRVDELLEPILRPGAHVLDVGCGTGVMVPSVLRRGGHYHGVDLSKNMIEQATRRYEATAEPTSQTVEFSVGDVEDIKYPEAHFDVVIALGLLEYLDDPQPAAEAMLRTTKPGGTIIISVPNAICVDAVADKLLSPFVTTAARAVRKLAGRATQGGGFSHHKFRPGRLDHLFTSQGCRKSGHAYYNFEVAVYPFRRFAPMPALRLKRWAEPYQRGPLRIFATAYIGRYVKGDAPQPKPTDSAV